MLRASQTLLGLLSNPTKFRAGPARSNAFCEGSSFLIGGDKINRGGSLPRHAMHNVYNEINLAMNVPRCFCVSLPTPNSKFYRGSLFPRLTHRKQKEVRGSLPEVPSTKRRGAVPRALRPVLRASSPAALAERYTEGRPSDRTARGVQAIGPLKRRRRGRRCMGMNFPCRICVSLFWRKFG